MQIGQFIHFPYTFAGLAVGGLVGLTGVGGGSLMTPLLVLMFGIHPATAVGTDLLYAGHHQNHGLGRSSPQWLDRMVRRAPPRDGNAPAALATLALLAYWGVQSQRSDSAISTILGYALLLTAMVLLFRPWLWKRPGRLCQIVRAACRGADRSSWAAFLGVMVTLSSVGAGAIGVTVLLMLFPDVDLAHRRARTSLMPCRFDADRRRRPLGHRLGRLADAGLSAARLDPGHHDRQPFRDPRARPRPARAAGRRAGACGRQTGVPMSDGSRMSPPDRAASASEWQDRRPVTNPESQMMFP